MTNKPIPQLTDFNQPYFEGCAAGELRIRRCNRCATKFRFNHYLCPNCWSDDHGWEVASGRGRVTHFTVVHQAPYESFEPDAPYAIVLVELDEGVRMMANLLDCDPASIHIGMKVKAIFEPRGEFHIPQFVPDD